MAKTRNYSIDVLRIVACMAVVLAHIIGGRDDALGSFEFNFCLFLKGIRRWDVPIFLMITGFFMLDPVRKFSLQKIYSKNVLRMVTALFFWSFIYAIVLHKPFYPLGSQEAHFWYLGMIIGVYIAIPVLRYIAARPSLLKYFMIIWFAVMLYKFLGNLVTLPFDMQNVIFVKYAGYCVLGYYVKYISTLTPSESPNIGKIRHGIYWLGLLGLCVTTVGGMVSQNFNSILFEYNAPNMILCSAGILLYCACHPLNLSGRRAALVLNCSECTFGIYLAHMLVLVEVFTRIRRFVPQMLPHMILSFLVAFFVGYGVTLLLKKIPILNKYVV